MFLEISQNAQENTCARASFLTTLQASGSSGLLFSFLVKIPLPELVYSDQDWKTFSLISSIRYFSDPYLVHLVHLPFLFGQFAIYGFYKKTNKLITNIKMLYILISVKVMPDPCNFLVRALSNFEKTFWLGLLSLSRFRNLLLSLVFNDNFREIRPIW